MTAMFDDDEDFGDIEEPPAPPQRLNQTLTVFSCPMTSKDTFKAPSVIEQKNKKDPKLEEIDKLRVSQLKAQGEASILRGELQKQTKDFNQERINLKKIESNLKDKMREDKKKFDDETAKSKTERIFLIQEMQQLKEKIQKLEGERFKDASQVPKRKVLEERKPERNSFPSGKEFKKSFNLISAETQTESKVRRRKCSLKPMDKSQMQTRAFAKISGGSAELKADLFQQLNTVDLRLIVSKEVKSLLGEVSECLPSFPTEDQLKTLHDLIACNNELVNANDRAAVTETCSKLFHQMIKTKKIDLLDPVLNLVLISWGKTLLNTDITHDIVSLLVKVFSLKDVREFITVQMIKTLFMMLSLIVSHPDHFHALCKQSENCALISILAIVQSCIRSGIVRFERTKY